MKEKKCDFFDAHGYCPKAHLTHDQLKIEIDKRKAAAEKANAKGKGRTKDS